MWLSRPVDAAAFDDSVDDHIACALTYPPAFAYDAARSTLEPCVGPAALLLNAEVTRLAGDEARAWLAERAPGDPCGVGHLPLQHIQKAFSQAMLGLWGNNGQIVLNAPRMSDNRRHLSLQTRRTAFRYAGSR